MAIKTALADENIDQLERGIYGQNVHLRNGLYEFLPIEIVNKIFTFMCSHTSIIIRHSKFYGKELPFMLLKTVGFRNQYTIASQSLGEFIVYRQQLCFRIVSHRYPNHPRRIYPFFVHSNDDIRMTSKDLGVDVREWYLNYLRRNSYCEYDMMGTETDTLNMFNAYHNRYFCLVGSVFLWLSLFLLILVFTLIGFVS